MKNLRKIIWGLVLIAAAVVVALNSFGIIDFDVFFDGWWTLFIIIPSFVGLFEKKNKTESLFGLLIGVVFLLCAQDILSWEMLSKLALPVFIAFIGIKMIISAFRRNKREKVSRTINLDGRDVQRGVAVFCGTELNFDNTVFEGAELITCFGGIECDLRNAIITQDAVIKVTCAFGGIDILVPDSVKVVNNTISAFGGVDVENSNKNGAYTIYVEGVCAFGGIDIE